MYGDKAFTAMMMAKVYCVQMVCAIAVVFFGWMSGFEPLAHCALLPCRCQISFLGYDLLFQVTSSWVLQANTIFDIMFVLTLLCCYADSGRGYGLVSRPT
jgi:hypothetical protein